MNRKYRKTIIAGNWKMNQLASTIKPFMEELKVNMPRTKTCDVVLCAPAIMVPALIRAGKECKIASGAQDVSCFEKGAYTGEISATQLADVGVKYCIVGHSERRQYHGEDDMLVNAKAKAPASTPPSCAAASSPMSPSGPSAPARPLPPSRPRKSARASVPLSARSTAPVPPVPSAFSTAAA